MLNKIKKTISIYNMFSKGESVLIGLSGGPDSVCLLYALKELSVEYKFKIFAAHLNHGYRGKESDGDEEFCRRLCDKLNIPFYTKKVKIKKSEDDARKARYVFYREVAEKNNVNKIALGHTADDEAETVLMRLLRGAGVRGLSGIPSVRKMGRIEIVRPLICVWKEEILVYLEKNKIRYRTDSSNLKTDFFRNKIRHNLIPYLEMYNPNIKSVLKNTGVNMAAMYDFLFHSVNSELKNNLRFNVSYLRKLPQILRQELIRRMAEDFDPELKLDARKTNDIVSLVSDSCGTKEVNLSKHVKAVREYDKLMFLRKGMEDSGYEEKISIPGKLKIKKHNLLITSMLCSKRSKNRNPFEVEIDYDKITYPLVIRTRRRGDIFCPIGLKGKKKVKDIFIDAKIPERLRNVVPLFVSGGDICWIPGYRIGEHYKITRDTKKILKIKTKGVENLWQTEVQS